MTLCTYGPEAERKRHWILKFEDADKGDMHFDDEAEAMKMFAVCDVNWNCTLFVTAEFKPIVIRARFDPLAAALTDEDWKP